MFDRKLFDSLVRRSRHEDTVPRKPPVFPLPTLNDQPPVVLVTDPSDPSIDVAYERSHLVGGPFVRSTTRDSPLYWIPKLTPVFAVSDGHVVYARRHSNGYVVAIDHHNDWLTMYSGLAHMFVLRTDLNPRRETKLCSGDILGYIGDSRPGPMRTLHFELWRSQRLQDFEAVDPVRFMRRWRQIEWNDTRSTSPPAPELTQ
jgi:hypothetical protein